jgi:Zn-dependent M28 family amino/carboxypeptidase
MYSADPQNRPIPGAWISGSFADQFLQSMDISLETLQHAVNEGKRSTHGPLPLAAHLRWNSQTAPGLLTNVLGIIPGSDPMLQHQTIVIGAHRDHFGEQAGLQFPGADDNASGTAVMLEVARILANATTNAQRTILFISFDGEERGLLGSRHYVANPTLPLRETVAMINLDHVGIGNGKLTIGLTRLNKTLAQQAAKQARLANKIQVYGYFPGGDHVPFYEMEVPTLTVVSAGVHPHFHQPSDIAKEIDPETVRTAARFVLSLVTLLAKSL